MGSSRDNLGKLVQAAKTLVEQLREADRQPDPEGFVRLTSEQTGQLIAVLRDVTEILKGNLDLIADAHGW
jgi:hypothetical protein